MKPGNANLVLATAGALCAFCVLFALAGCVDGGKGDGDAGPDAAAFECPNGLNPDGNGCFIPCENGWHEGADGYCHKDCLEGFAEDENGLCDMAVCAEGETSVPWGLLDPDDEEIVGGTFCVPGCPEGMLTGGVGLNLYCYLPCPDGWYRDDDTGRCHLECPDGMAETEVDGGTTCDLVEVGERKECPAGLYDTSVTGPNPIYVNAAAGDPSPDSGVDHPFATIGDAVAAGGDAMTIYVAPGTYAEQVVLDGLSEVNLIGACADEVSIVGEGLGLIDGKDSAAIHATNVDALLVDGFAITSDLNGIRVRHETVGSSLVVRNNRVGPTVLGGIRAAGLYDSVDVIDNTVEQASVRGIIIDMDIIGMAEEPVGGTVLASGNEVRGLVDCVPPAVAPDACPAADYMTNDGINVWCATDATLRGNRVSDFENVSWGIGAVFAESASIQGNAVRDLAGSFGIDAWLAPGDSEADPVAELSGNVVEDCLAGPNAGLEASTFIGISVDLDVGTADASISNNLVRRIQGVGIWSSSSTATISSDLRENELEALPFAFWLGGRLIVEGNRIYDSKTNINTISSSTLLEFRENHFADCASAAEFVLPEGDWKDMLDSRGWGIVLMADPSATGVVFSGNQVERCSDGNGAVNAYKMRDITASGNFFYQNTEEYTGWATCDLFVFDSEQVMVGNNIFVGSSVGSFDVTTGPHPAALCLGGEAVNHLSDVQIADNYFRAYSGGYSVVTELWVDGMGHFALDGNTFSRAGGIAFQETEATRPAASVSLTNNEIVFTWLWLMKTGEAEVASNAIFQSPASVSLQETGASLELAGNLFEGTGLFLSNNAPDVAQVAINEFYRPLGYAVSAVDSRNVVIEQNGISQVRGSTTCPGVGLLSDAVHVAGNEGQSDAQVLANRFDGTGRLGVLASSSRAVVEGNMYVDCGEGCGGTCDLAVQYEPEEGAVTGWDTDFASYPEEPYGAMTWQYWCY